MGVHQRPEGGFIQVHSTLPSIFQKYREMLIISKSSNIFVVKTARSLKLNIYKSLVLEISDLHSTKLKIYQIQPPIVYLHSALKQSHDFSRNSSLGYIHHQERKPPNSLAIKFASARYVAQLSKSLNCQDVALLSTRPGNRKKWIFL